MRQIGAFAVALTLAVSPAFAETLTIQHAIEMALAGDPDIAASRAAQAEAREQQVAASHGSAATSRCSHSARSSPSGTSPLMISRSHR
jgi:hypothetical protein